MVLKRKEAVMLASFIKFFSLSESERGIAIKDCGAELEYGEDKIEVANYQARKFIEYEFSFVTNNYLEPLLSNHFKTTVSIKGSSKKLLTCVCCAYNTIEKRGEYYICPVCYWEDDGNDDPERFSDVNKMQLAQARFNFEKVGVIHQGYLLNADGERMMKYRK